MDDLQGEAVLTVRIATEESVELKDLTDSLQAFEAQYRRTQEHLFPERDVSESVLIVKDVRSGSIIFDLIPILAPIIQEVEQIKSIVDYVDTFRTKVLPWLQPGGPKSRRDNGRAVIISQNGCSRGERPKRKAGYQSPLCKEQRCG